MTLEEKVEVLTKEFEDFGGEIPSREELIRAINDLEGESLDYTNQDDLDACVFAIIQVKYPITPEGVAAYKAEYKARWGHEPQSIGRGL